MPTFMGPYRGAAGLRPNATAALNYASPQARGLVAWLPTPPTTPQPIECVANLPMTLTALGGGAAPTLMPSTAGGGSTLFSTGYYYTNSAFARVGAANATIAQWFYAPDTSRQGIFIKVGGGTSGFGLGIGGFNPNTNGSQVWGLYEYVRYVGTVSALLDYRAGVNHAVMTIDGSGFPTIYVNGRFAHTDTGSAPSSPSAGLNIGYSGSSNGPSPNGCALLDGRVYNRALSAAEVWNLYANPWDLYYVPGRRVFFDLAAPPATGRSSRLALLGVA